MTEKKRSNCNGGSDILHPATRKRIVELAGNNLTLAAEAYSKVYERHYSVKPSLSYCKRTLSSVLAAADSRFRLPTRRTLEEFAGVKGEFRVVPIEVAPTVDRFRTFEREPELQETNETGIVRYVEGIPFTLTSLSQYGAENARITLTHLAEKLGYSDKSKLKQLAERHASELAEFGISATVAVLSSRGNGAVVTVYEPTYNPDQAAYLALSSETEQGRACRVKILKAYKALLAMFEAEHAALVPQDAFMRQMLQGQQEQTRALTALTMALAGGRVARRRAPTVPSPPVQQVIPQTVPAAEPCAPSELRRLSEQEAFTERKVLHAMLKRLAGVTKDMPSVEYGARMSVAFHKVDDELQRYGHNMSEDMSASIQAGQRINSLDYFEQKGIVRLVMRIVEELYKAKAPT